MAREEVPMSLRRAIVEADTRELNVTEFCRLHGVSTWFFWDLRRRYAVEGEAALTPKSRAPHHPAGRTPTNVEDAIVAKRKELDDAGLDCGPASIAFHLRDLAGVPSESTIWRILTARGLITPQPAKAPKHSGRSYTAERANECWALDDWDWALADGTGSEDPRRARRSQPLRRGMHGYAALHRGRSLRCHRCGGTVRGLAGTVLVRQRQGVHQHARRRPRPARCRRQPHPPPPPSEQRQG
jgi:hypothetical protein